MEEVLLFNKFFPIHALRPKI